MLKLFISGPMRGREIEDIKKDRVRAQKIVENKLGKSVEVIPSLLDAYLDPVLALASSIEYLSRADLAFFCKGWDKARGCKVEHLICELYGINTMEEKGI